MRSFGRFAVRITDPEGTVDKVLKSLAGLLYEVQKRNLAREPEVVAVAFARWGRASVPDAQMSQ